MISKESKGCVGRELPEASAVAIGEQAGVIGRKKGFVVESIAGEGPCHHTVTPMIHGNRKGHVGRDLHGGDDVGSVTGPLHRARTGQWHRALQFGGVVR